MQKYKICLKFFAKPFCLCDKLEGEKKKTKGKSAFKIITVKFDAYIALWESLHWEGNLRNLISFLNKRKELEFTN